jgi:membrane-bound lytic murein transglycosylase D
MRFFAVALIFFGVAASFAQTPEVPHKIHFAGMVLTIRDDAKREIQKDVDALTKHKRYFEMNVERARTYFPIIEKIFKEEQLPEDFKYLALQESSLTPDAVSVSNAVGFWQFKDYTAQEMGMRVDNQIDERMNIVSSTRGAAKYLKQNNWRFNNWLLALQAYQMGAGGVERAVGDKYNGDSHMEITSETYWYVKKYLAHKVAFETAGQGSASLKVSLYETRSEKKLSEIASEVSVDESVLKEYNKWAKNGTIPNDKPYLLVIPSSTIQDFNSLTLSSEKASKAVPFAKANHGGDVKTTINGVAAIKANQGETLLMVASRAGLDVSKFIKYNDLSIDHTIRPGAFYFVKRKKKMNPAASYHTKIGDDLWLVSQQFGIRLKNLKKLNPGVNEDGFISSGSNIALNDKAAPLQASVAASDDVAELSNDVFTWAVQPRAVIYSKPNTIEASLVVQNDPRQPDKQLVQGNHLDSLINHEVQQGETLYSIANKYSVTVSDLLSANQLDVATPLKRGQVISVHKQSSQVVSDNHDLSEKVEQQEAFIYEVKNSDTLYGIARQFGATIKEIMDWNNKSVLTVSAGEKLKILKR